MDMEIIMILLIWLVAPFAEAGVIIGLAIANGRHKKRIQELTCQLERQRLYGFEREKPRAGEMPPDPPKPETLSDGWLVPASIVKASWGQTGKTIVVPQEYPNTVHIINRNKGPEPVSYTHLRRQATQDLPMIPTAGSSRCILTLSWKCPSPILRKSLMR